MNDRANISKRLLEERERKKIGQQQMADFGGVALRTYCNYESGERMPGALFFAALAAVEIDVNYILTGQRTHLISEDQPGYTLRPDQKALLDNLEHCSRQDQDHIKRMALLAAEAATCDETQQKTNHS